MKHRSSHLSAHPSLLLPVASSQTHLAMVKHCVQSRLRASEVPIRQTGAILKRPSRSGALVHGRARGVQQIVRHQELTPLINGEIEEWTRGLKDGTCVSLVCPICGWTAEKLHRLKHHAESHRTGKKSALHTNLESGKQLTHPVFMAVVRALFDGDRLAGKSSQAYMSRATSLLTTWLFPDGIPAGMSVWAGLGKRDSRVEFVFTKTGPEYWRMCDSGLDATRKIRDVHYTQDFADLFLKQLLLTSGSVSPAMSRVLLEWQGGGCEVGLLGLRRSETVRAMALDIMESPTVERVRSECIRQYVQKGSLKCISIDGTYKLALKAREHSHGQQHNYVTVVGGDGCALAIQPCRTEGVKALCALLKNSFPAEVRHHVQYIGFDFVYESLLRRMRDVFPNLKAAYWDAMHLTFNTDKCRQKRRIKPNVSGLVLRTIMDKFNARGDGRIAGAFYEGSDIAPSHLECSYLTMIEQ